MTEEYTIINAFEFSDSIVKVPCENFQETLEFLKDFTPKYQEEREKLPYHINVIDELCANENAHSRIFAQLLRYKKNGKFVYLESFLKEVAKFNLVVKNPKVEKVDSCGRIDIPIFDDDFVLVIENKVTDKAPDQNTEKGGQLARYIETIRDDYNREVKQIYVIYTPKYTREPSDECWINKEGHSYKADFKDRFCSLSYRDKIYPQIKNTIFPTIADKDNYLKSALEQYIDHLKGLFSLREINKNMNMELQTFIKEKLELSDDNPKEAIKILTEKKNELNQAITQVEQLLSIYKKQLIRSFFEEWKQQLQRDFRKFKLDFVGDTFNLNSNVINIGVRFKVNDKYFSALLECNDCDNQNIYFGIGRGFASEKKHDISEKLSEIIDKGNLTKPDEWWYGWKYTSVQDGYQCLSDLIKKICVICVLKKSTPQTSYEQNLK
ncbi:MAG: PD-(D/E)XK nuclease family protein [Bacteroidales bacterium]|jgi:hypothetical protein|nr:PD-(D/E)XK nuclease family protein [Bacteroidales bacterium]